MWIKDGVKVGFKIEEPDIIGYWHADATMGFVQFQELVELHRAYSANPHRIAVAAYPDVNEPQSGTSRWARTPRAPLVLYPGQWVEVLAEVSATGWCYGRANGRSGVFPAHLTLDPVAWFGAQMLTNSSSSPKMIWQIIR